MKKRVAVVTGASSGLGRDIAKLLAENGMIVYSVARRKEMLMELKKECSKFEGEIRVIAGDLTKKDFREKMIKEVLNETKKIDYLINNAGYGKLTDLENTDLEDIEGMFALNSIAGEHLTHLCLPNMKKRKEGRIINISSVVALQPPVYFSVYNATKYAVYGFSKSLSYELAGTGVSVSVVFPSRMKTPFWEVAFKCRGLTEKQQKVCTREWAEKSPSSLPVAKYIVRNLDSKRLIFLPDFLSKFSYHFLRHFYFIGDFYMKNIMLPKTKKIFGKKQ